MRRDFDPTAEYCSKSRARRQYCELGGLRVALRVMILPLLATITPAGMAAAQSQPATAESGSTAPARQAKAADTGKLEEIVVTAQRRSQSIMKVPISISALSTKDLKDQGITQSGDLSASVPNLQVNSGFGEAEPNFALRGIGVGNEYDANQESPVGVYVDDEYFAFRTMQGMQLYDLSRIEVLSGPQGTLYGRNTTGGLVNFITNKPSLTGDNGYIEFGYGNYNDVRTQLAFEKTIIPGELGIRGAISYESNDGYVKNIAPGQANGDSIDSVAGRVNVRWRPNADLDVDLRLMSSGGDPSQAAIFERGIGPNLTNPLTGYSRAGLGFWTVDEPHMGLNTTHQVGGLLTTKYRFADQWTLTWLSSYDIGSSNFTQEGTGGPVDLLDTRYHNDYKQANEELRVSYDSPRTNFQAGLYYGWDRNATLDKYAFFLAFPFAETVTQQYLETRDSKAVFAQVDQKFFEHWTVTGGIRYTYDQASYANGQAFIGDRYYNPVDYTVPGPQGGYLPTLHNSDGAFTGRFALTYTADSGQIAYFSYNHGYRSGNYTGQGYFSPAQIYYVQPESVDAYEVGAKGRFLDGRLQVSLALFDDEYKNQQLNEVIGAVGFLRNAGASTIYGLESNITARVNDDLRGHFSVGLLHATYDQLTLSGTNLDGNTLPFAPVATINAGADWDFATWAGGTFTFSPVATFTSQEYFSPFNTVAGNRYLQQGNLAKIDLNLRYEWDRWTARLWVTNLLNAKSFTYGLNLQGSFGYDYLLQGPPQMFGASLRYEF